MVAVSDIYEFIDGSSKDVNTLIVDYVFDSEVTRREEAIETISLMSKLLTVILKVGTKDYIFSVSSEAKRKAKEFTYKPTMFAKSPYLKEVDDEYKFEVKNGRNRVSCLYKAWCITRKTENTLLIQTVSLTSKYP